MNKNLLTPGNTTCSENTLKSIAAVLLITAVFVFAQINAFAQASETINAAPSVKETKKVEHIQVIKAQPAQQPVEKTVETQEVKAREKKVEHIPVTTKKQAVTSESAETIDNAKEVPAAAPVKTEMKVATKTAAAPQPAPKAGTYSPAEKKDENADLPYYKYKGIENIEEAKKAWVADHPAEHKTMQGTGTSNAKPTNVSAKPAVSTNKAPAPASLQGTGVQKPVAQQPATAKPANGQLPNADRRLPANYDDSKTNIQSKE